MSKKFRNFDVEQFTDSDTVQPFKKKAKGSNPSRKHNKTKRRKEEIDI